MITKTTAWDRLVAAKPGPLSRTEREAMLSRVLTSSPDDTSAVFAPGLWQRSGGTPHRRRADLAGTAAALVAATAGISIGLGTTGHRAGAKVRLVSYTFELPSGYQAAQAPTRSCDAASMVSWPTGTFNSPQQMFTQFDGTPDEPGIVSAVSATGGCVSMALVGPYTPGGPLTPTVAGIGGPLPVPGGPTPEQLLVGTYPALLGSFIPTSVPNLGAVAPGGTTTTVPATTTELVLDVTIPATGGQVQNLLVSSTNLSQQALISIVTQGLTGTSPTT